MKPSEKKDTECYFCGPIREEVSEEHHPIPREVVMPGEETDETEITVTLCANCHNKMHALLDPLIRFMGKKQRELPEDVSVEFESAAELGEE